MRVCVAQYNPTVGDLAGNAARLLAACRNAGDLQADLLVAPELALCGYPPRDLLDRPSFVRDCLAMLHHVVHSAPIPLLFGAVVGAGVDVFDAGSRIANGAVLAQGGEVRACHRKNLLPTYDVFDEARYFTPGTKATTAMVGEHRIGISVCEDIWNDKAYWSWARYDRDPVAESVAAGAELLINLSASPFHRDKPQQRLQMLAATAKRHARPILYVNQVGGNDSLIFDGRSLAVQGDGRTTLRCAAFREVLALANYEHGALRGEMTSETTSFEEDICEALSLGVRDYLTKCGYAKVIVGLSGGIDSAVVAALAVQALGPSKVQGVAMPSRYSSPGSLTDAQALAEGLGIRLDTVSIEPMYAAALGALQTPFAGMAADLTEENLQARLRGLVLMAFSNKLGALVLSTGNKSEIAVGYTTLYGDMCGGLSPLSDLYKGQVYALGRYLNGALPRPAIPASTFDKPPSAELRPDQRDDDSLPPYPTLDAVLHSMLEEGLSPAELRARGFDPALLARVANLLQRSEHKRRQMAPGLRLSTKAFGEGRRLPIAQRYVFV